VPILSTLFAGPPYGIGVLTAGLILAIMVLPFITSISRDVFDAVPPMLKESAYGLGCTTWEVVRYVVLPYARVGVIGGIMLGLGRALGETMAVTFVIGNAHKISASILAPGTTISATIANEFTEAVGDLYTSSLIALGLILFVITFIVLDWIFVLRALPDFERFKPVPGFAQTLSGRIKPDDALITYDEALPSLVFYLQRHIDPYFLPDEVFERFRENRGVYAIMSDENYAELAPRIKVRTCIIDRRPTFDVKLKNMLNRDSLPELLIVTNRCPL